jgi:hypothetical protein
LGQDATRRGRAAEGPRLADLGPTMLVLSSAFGKVIADEIEKWVKLVKFAGLKSE